MNGQPSDAGPRGHEAVADALVRGGVQCIFGVLGDDTAPVVVTAVSRGISYHPARHENQAVAMADGYFRATGRMGVVALTGGPGLTNALTAIYTAQRAGSGVLVVSGAGRAEEDDGTPDGVRNGTPVGWLKHFPQAAVLQAAGIACRKPLTSDTVVDECARAIEEAARRPVVLILARSLLLSVVPPRLANAPAGPIRDAAAIDAAKIAEVCDLLQETWAIKQPLVLAGRGAMKAGAGPALRQLAARIGALLATSLPARGLFGDDPFAIGVCGTYATPLASELIPQADCVLAFGATLNPWTTYRNALFPKALLVQVDADADAIGRFLPAALGLQGDAKQVAQAIVAELERRSHQAAGCRSAPLADRIAAFRSGDEVVDRSTEDRIDPRTLMLALDARLPPDRILCADAGQQARFAIRYFETRKPGNFVQSVDAGSIGLGLGMAIGIALARPEQLVVATIGDGSAMMALGDLETAVRLRLSMLIVVSNDESYGAEVNAIAALGMDGSIANTSCPSFEAMARAMGAIGATISRTADLAVLDDWARDRPAMPLVLDCRVNPAVRAE